MKFKLTNGNMHAYEHDAHMEMLLGAAKILKQNENILNGRIKLIFQLGEEVCGGAKVMNMMQGILTRENDPQNPVVISIANIRSEQPLTPAHNIIPNYVEMFGTVRCLENTAKQFVNKRIEEIVKCVTTMGNNMSIYILINIQRFIIIVT